MISKSRNQLYGQIYDTLAIKSCSGMQSKVFDKSVNKNSKIPFLSMLFVHFSIITKRQSWILKRFLVRYWGFEEILGKKQRADFKVLLLLLKTGFISASVIVDENCEKVIA